MTGKHGVGSKADLSGTSRPHGVPPLDPPMGAGNEVALTRGLHRGSTRLRLGEDAYGMRVRREIEARTGRHVSAGGVHATLDRLEEKGLARSVVGDPLPGRGGRARRTFEVTGSGAHALDAARRVLARMSEGLFTDPEPA